MEPKNTVPIHMALPKGHMQENVFKLFEDAGITVGLELASLLQGRAFCLFERRVSRTGLPVTSPLPTLPSRYNWATRAATDPRSRSPITM